MSPGPRRRARRRTAVVVGAAAGTAGYVAGKSKGKQEPAKAEAPATKPPPTKSTATKSSTPKAQGDKYDQLAKIADLRERGALTDAEFKAEKKKILDS